MNYTEKLDLITEKMMYFNQNDPKRIHDVIYKGWITPPKITS